MADLHNRADTLRRVGSMEQLAYVRPVRGMDGRADGLRMIEVDNGRLHFEVLADKCLDIASLRLDGRNLTFLAKNGLQGAASYETNGQAAQRAIMGGLFFTCGPENVGPPHVFDGRDLPMHGSFRATPASHLSCDACWEGDTYVLTLSGEMRVGQLFGENIVLRRTIFTEAGSTSLTVADEITNEGFADFPFELLYHCNFGYPLLDAGAEIVVPGTRTVPRDAAAAVGLEHWMRMDAPVDCAPEQVFYHEGLPNGAVRVGVRNPDGHALWLDYDRRELPVLTQWKSFASGDYVLGLEPGNCHVEGAAAEHAQGTLQILKPMETRRVTLTFTAE